MFNSDIIYHQRKKKKKKFEGTSSPLWNGDPWSSFDMANNREGLAIKGSSMNLQKFADFRYSEFFSQKENQCIQFRLTKQIGVSIQPYHHSQNSLSHLWISLIQIKSIFFLKLLREFLYLLKNHFFFLLSFYFLFLVSQSREYLISSCTCICPMCQLN